MNITHRPTATETASAELAERAARTSRQIEADHQRLIGAIQRLEIRGRGPLQVREAGYITDPYKWRRRLIAMTGARCPKCFGRGWVGTAETYDECPMCGPLHRRNDDLNEPAF